MPWVEKERTDSEMHCNCHIIIYINLDQSFWLVWLINFFHYLRVLLNGRLSFSLQVLTGNLNWLASLI